MKRIFLLLVVLNLGVFLWLYPRHAERERTAKVLEPEIGDLRLLSEIEGFGDAERVSDLELQPRLAQASQPQPELMDEPEQAVPDEVELAPGRAQEALEVTEGEGEVEQAQVPAADGEQSAAEAMPDEPLPETAESDKVQSALELVPEMAQLPEADLEQAQVMPADEEQMAIPAAETVPGELPPAMTERVEEQAMQALPADAEADVLSEPAIEGTAEQLAETQLAEEAISEVLPQEPGTAPVCYRLGPIERQAQADQLADRLGSLADEVEVLEESVLKDAGYWVIYPPAATAEQAQAKERKLKAAGIKDIWRIREGDMKDAISLGLFFEKKNADTLMRQLEAKGFKPKIQLRQVEQPVYWVQLQAREDAATLEQIKAALPRQLPALVPEPVSCPSVVSP